MEVEKPAAPGRVQLVRASTHSLEVCWTPSPTAETYLLQIQKYEMPPTAPVSPASSVPVPIKFGPATTTTSATTTTATTTTTSTPPSTLTPLPSITEIIPKIFNQPSYVGPLIPNPSLSPSTIDTSVLLSSSSKNEQTSNSSHSGSSPPSPGQAMMEFLINPLSTGGFISNTPPSSLTSPSPPSSSSQSVRSVNIFDRTPQSSPISSPIIGGKVRPTLNKCMFHNFYVLI